MAAIYPLYKEDILIGDGRFEPPYRDFFGTGAKRLRVIEE
jgi:hypothetical protein